MFMHISAISYVSVPQGNVIWMTVSIVVCIMNLLGIAVVTIVNVYSDLAIVCLSLSFSQSFQSFDATLGNDCEWLLQSIIYNACIITGVSLDN